VTMLTVVAAIENWVNIRPRRLMPCRWRKQRVTAGVFVSLHAMFLYLHS
jgi:hypothetical protein